MAAGTLGVSLAVLSLLVACSRDVPPETVAVEYARALYARDLSRAYRLISARDRQWKTETTFVAEGEAFTGSLLEASRHLASFIEPASVQGAMNGDRVEIKLRLRLPDANAPEIASLFRDWDEAALKGLADEGWKSIRNGLDRLHRGGKLPMLEGEESFVLVREAEGWQIVVRWADGVRLRVRARIPEGLPLRVVPEEQELLLRPGEQVRMTVQLTNPSERDLSMRIAHEIEPKAAAPSLVFVQCPLLLPVKLRPEETREFSSTLMLAGGGPDRTDGMQVTFVFRSGE